MRAIAEETFAMVREYKGSHSGEHGDGLVRSEFHEAMFGPRIVARFQGGQAPLRSGQCAQSRQDRRCAADGRPRAVSLSAGLSRRRAEDGARLVGLSRRRRRLPGRGRDVQQQRRLPQARGRRDVPVLSRHPQREGRHARPRQYAAAGDLRPARAGRAGLRRDDGDAETLRVLQGLPPRMPDRRRHGQDEDRGAGRAQRQSTGFRCATGWSAICRAMRGLAARLAPLANWRNNSPLLRRLFEKFAGISAQRALPRMAARCVQARRRGVGPADGREVVLFADTFNRAYERENLDAALRVLVAGGYRVHIPRPADGGRPLCCGRTFLSAGLVDHARAELDRLVATYAPFAARGVPIVGLEPSCLLTLRDELLSLRSDDDAQKRQRARAVVRGISGARGRGRPPAAAARPHRRQGAGARPLPSEIVRRVQAGRAGASAHSRI